MEKYKNFLYDYIFNIYNMTIYIHIYMIYIYIYIHIYNVYNIYIYIRYIFQKLSYIALSNIFDDG